MHSTIRTTLFSLGGLCALLTQAQAYELYRDEGTQLNADLTVVYGVLSSEHNYIGRSGSFHWQEGFAKYGFRGETDRIGAGSVYGSLALISSGTWGDGDPGGYSVGKERRTSFEDAYLGWRSGDLVPALGQNGIDISFGRQSIKLGRGFLVYDDAANPGRGMGKEFDRGALITWDPAILSQKQLSCVWVGRTVCMLARCGSSLIIRRWPRQKWPWAWWNTRLPKAPWA